MAFYGGFAPAEMILDIGVIDSLCFDCVKRCGDAMPRQLKNTVFSTLKMLYTEVISFYIAQTIKED